MKSVFVVILCFCFATVWAKEEKTERIRYCTTLEEAMRQASREHKPIFFNCYADWAGASILMDSVVLAEPELVSFIEKHFVSLRVDMMKTEEGRKLAERYGVKYFAHFLILDKKGDVQHRIIGGSRAPEFQEKLAQGLNPKTSLAGMTRRYEKGDRRLEFLSAYAEVLDLADEREKYREVADYYLQHADTAEMCSPVSWKLLTKQGRQYESEWFNFIYAHRDKLIRENGEAVNDFIVQSAFQQFYPYLLLERPYDPVVVGGIERKIGVLDTNSVSRRQLLEMCRLADLRKEKRYAEMLDVWETIVPVLSGENLKARLDVTLGLLQEMGESEKQRAVAYLNRRKEGKRGTQLERYNQAVRDLSDYQGIVFETGTLQEALEKAQAENKAVFVDCYTSWCGPCKMMSARVFPDKLAGDFFNPRFVSIKIDMEKGEGKELRGRWDVTAYPTYLVLDARGEVVHTSRGYIPAEELVERMKVGFEKWKNSMETNKN